MIRLMHARLRRKGVTGATLHARASNTSAIGLYQSEGYICSGVFCPKRFIKIGQSFHILIRYLVNINLHHSMSRLMLSVAAG